MISLRLDEEFCTVGARRDIDGAYLELVVEPDRERRGTDADAEIVMTPAAARRLVRELNRWLRATKELS